MNRRSVIKKPCSSAGAVKAASQDVVTQVLGAVSTALGTVSSLLVNRLPAMPHQAPPILQAQTPDPASHQVEGTAVHRPNSPVLNTPTKLARFLKYSEKQLGIRNVMLHKTRLEIEGYGPDILADIEDQQLTKPGISPGDVIQLKRAAPGFWEMEKVRPKHSAEEAFGDDSDDDSLSGRCTKKKDEGFRFEKRFKGADGTCGGAHGSACCYGLEIVPGAMNPNADYIWYYFSEEFKAFVLIPPGFVPVLDAGKDSGAMDDF